MEIELRSIDETMKFASTIGRMLEGGEVFELVGDVGAGKTTFTKGLAEGIDIDDDVQSPTFTISRVYDGRDSLRLYHYDFYRLADPGVMSYDIAESVSDKKGITIVEWAETVADILPEDRIVVNLTYGDSEETRVLSIKNPTKSIEEAYATWNKN